MTYFNSDFKKARRPPKSKKPLRRTGIKKKFPKASGEAVIFTMIANTRGNKCQVCGKQIIEFGAGNFSHLLSKGTRPDLRLNPKNILIMCFNMNGSGCHNRYDTIAESKLLEANYKMWKPIFELRDKLKTFINS